MVVVSCTGGDIRLCGHVINNLLLSLSESLDAKKRTYGSRSLDSWTRKGYHEQLSTSATARNNFDYRINKNKQRPTREENLPALRKREFYYPHQMFWRRGQTGSETQKKKATHDLALDQPLKSDALKNFGTCLAMLPETMTGTGSTVKQ